MDTARAFLFLLTLSLLCVNGIEGCCVFFGKKYRHNEPITQSHLENYHGYCSGYVCINSKIEFRDLFKCESVKGNRPHPIGCMVGNQYYRPQETVQIGVDDNNCKFRKVCMEGGAIVTLKDPTCNSTTTQSTTFEITTTPEITTPKQCLYNGKYYLVGTVIEKGHDGSQCYDTICDAEGNVIYDVPCDTTTTDKTTTIRTTTPAIPQGYCLYNGQYYSPGTVIEEGQDGSWCYSTICDPDGNVLAADNFDCDTTTRQTTTPTDTTSTTTTQTTTPLRLYCQYNGQYYPPGTVIEKTQCSSTICDPDGNLLVADNFDCDTTTGQTTTPTDTTSTTTTETTSKLLLYCQYNGQNYPPGTVIEQSQCSSTICDPDGNLLVADNFDCDTTTGQTTTPTDTTSTSTTTRITTSPGPLGYCLYNGQYYPLGTVIWQGRCSSTICDSDGNVLITDDFQCDTSTDETTTTTTTRTTTTAKPPGYCLYNGQFYPPGTVIEEGQQGSWCYSTICDTDGNVIHADDFNCGATTQQTTTPTDTTTTSTTTPGPQGYCLYNGKYYPPWTVIEKGQEGSWCYSTTCDYDGNVIHADDFNCGTTTRQTTTPADTSTTP